MFRRVFELACARSKVSKHGLMVLLGFSPKHRHRNYQTFRYGEDVGFERFLKAARMAGIPDSHAAVIWAKNQIPEDYAHLREFVGCTKRLPSTKDCGRTRKSGGEVDRELGREVRGFIRDNCPPNSRRIPQP